MNKEPRFPGAVLLTLIFSVILTIVPLGESLSVWRPEWIALTLIHWSLVIKDRISLVMAFVLGLVIDTLFSSMLGPHALSFLLVTYLSVRLGVRMSPESAIQQMALIIAVLFLHLLLGLWLQGFTGNSMGGWSYWASLLSSVVVWPFYHALLGSFHVQRRVI